MVCIYIRLIITVSSNNTALSFQEIIRNLKTTMRLLLVCIFFRLDPMQGFV